MKPIDLKAKSDAQLRAIIANHERLGKTDLPSYRDACDELARRSAFNFETSLKAISEAAREKRFLSYGALAEASGVEWNKAYLLIGAHLWELVRWGHARGLPMLSAIVVNKENLATGIMAEETLQGFVRAAEALGITVKEPETFREEQQALLFAHFGKA
ncbi:MAG: hypothetical protein JSR87_03265 [Proteobacteria bacterium]|nr:hypothetical protein [Pseudomonadota bacterium]MBS0574525.1 hypothetical protein [Pseudomonadota bacterium]